MKVVMLALAVWAVATTAAAQVSCYDERGEAFTMSLSEYRSEHRRPCFSADNPMIQALRKQEEQRARTFHRETQRRLARTYDANGRVRGIQARRWQYVETRQSIFPLGFLCYGRDDGDPDWTQLAISQEQDPAPARQRAWCERTYLSAR